MKKTITLLLVVVASCFGFRACSRTPYCAPPAHYSTSANQCVVSLDLDSNTQPAPVICAPQACADPARRSSCTNCR